VQFCPLTSSSLLLTTHHQRAAERQHGPTMVRRARSAAHGALGAFRLVRASMVPAAPVGAPRLREHAVREHCR